MMKITKLTIASCADELLNMQERITQIDVHKAIEERLGRKLTRHEKSRITQVLRNRYVVSKTIIDTKSKRRIEYFE